MVFYILESSGGERNREEQKKEQKEEELEMSNVGYVENEKEEGVSGWNEGEVNL